MNNNKFEKEIRNFLLRQNMPLYLKSMSLYLLYSEGAIIFVSACHTLEMHLENIIDDMIELIVRGMKIKNSTDQNKIAEYEKEVEAAIHLIDLEMADAYKGSVNLDKINTVS